jgi:formate dehydrogenase
MAEVERTLAGRPRDRDQLIELLHALQDSYGCLHARHLVALARSMRLAMAEVFEVASFYAHFDIVDDGEDAPPSVTVRVCDSLSCALVGADKLFGELSHASGTDFRVVRAPCMGRCDKAPVVAVGHSHLAPAVTGEVRDAVAAGRVSPAPVDHADLEAYRASGGYRLLQDCTSGDRPVDEIIGTMEGSGLRGLGGAGFPAGRKWRFVRAEKRPRLLAVNADEGEPGTFKDHHYLARDPHRFLEGMLIAAWAVEAEDLYIYLRDEYPVRRGVGDAGKHRGQAWPAAAQAALSQPGGAIRTPDPDPQCGDALLGARDRRARRGVVHIAGAERSQRAAQLFGFGPG